MNGLEYLCIRWNFSQSFLAEMVGVSRQAVGQWYKSSGLMNSRKVKLMDFFGIDKDIFGELTEEGKNYIDSLPVYRHRSGNHEFYLHRVDRIWYDGGFIKGKAIAEIRSGESTGFVLEGEPIPEFKPEPSPLVSMDDRLAMASKQLSEIHDRINHLAECDYDEGTRLNFTGFMIRDLRPVLDVIERIRSCKNRAHSPYLAIYDNLVTDVENALALTFRAMSEQDLPKDMSETHDINKAYGNKSEFAIALKKVIEDELKRRCSLLAETTNEAVPPIEEM